MIWIAKVVAILLLFAFISHIRADGQSSAQADCQTQLFNQIIGLRADLTEYLIEQQEIRIAALTRELEGVRKQTGQLTDDDRQHAENIAEIDQQLSTRELEPEARPQIEALKAQLMSEGFQKLRTDRAELAQHDTALTQQLQRESARRQKLQDRARQLQLALGHR